MTYIYTFNAFMGIIIACNVIFTITQVFCWYDRLLNFTNKFSGNKDYKSCRTKCFVSFFILVLFILSFIFINSNNLIP